MPPRRAFIHDHVSTAFVVQPLERRELLAGAELDSNGTLSIIGTIKADAIFVTYGPDALDRVFVEINHRLSSFLLSRLDRIRIQAGAGDDIVAFQGFARLAERFDIPSTIYGSTGDDRIVASAAPSRIYGGTGNDRIAGGFSRDIIYGEHGNDRIDGDQGNDYIRGGPGNDNLVGGLGVDDLAGEEGNDIFVTRADIPFMANLPTPFPMLPTFDRVDGGPGFDRADGDDNDRLISIEATFRTPGL